MALDEATFTACFQRLEGSLYNVLLRWFWNPAECQDVIQEAFLRVWAQRARLDAEALDPVIWTTCLNLARNRRRWQRLWRWVSAETMLDQTVGDDGAGILGSADQQRVRHALERLPDDARQILLLAEFAGLSTKELAQVLAIAPGTVASRKHRAIAQLRRLLGVAKDRRDDHD